MSDQDLPDAAPKEECSDPSTREERFECEHGWRALPIKDRISTACPACGGESLFIGSGGHLTCSRLSCPEPGLRNEINNLRAALEDALLTLIAIASQPATAGRLWADNPTLGTTLARVRKALRQMEPDDPLARRVAAGKEA